MGNAIRKVEFHPDARLEADEAFIWYYDQSRVAAAKLKADLNEVIEIARETPLRYPSYMKGTRRGLLPRFKYLVVYLVYPDRILVVAVAHGNREPEYWSARLDNQ